MSNANHGAVTFIFIIGSDNGNYMSHLLAMDVPSTEDATNPKC